MTAKHGPRPLTDADRDDLARLREVHPGRPGDSLAAVTAYRAAGFLTWGLDSTRWPSETRALLVAAPDLCWILNLHDPVAFDALVERIGNHTDLLHALPPMVLVQRCAWIDVAKPPPSGADACWEPLDVNEARPWIAAAYEALDTLGA